MRFNEPVRALNAISFAVMTVFASGISMDALARLLTNLLPWKLATTIFGMNFGSYDIYLWICSGVVLIYVLKGGLTSAIYTEVLQFFMIVLGFAPVVYLGLQDAGGWHAMNHALQGVATNPAAFYLQPAGIHYAPDAWTSAWKPVLAGPAANPLGVDWFAVVFGLGFVLSFGYWCTNFLVVQRAMAAKNMTAARNTPLVAAVPKMLFPLLVILPGMIAIALASMPNKDYRIPPPIVSQENYTKAVDVVKNASPADAAAVKAVGDALGVKVNAAKVTQLIADNAANKLSDDQIQEGLYNSIAENDYNSVILSLLKKYCPPGLLGLALTALLASFMSGMAGNVTAFNTVWTYDLYQAYFVPNKSDAHYFWMGKFITVVGIVIEHLLRLFCQAIQQRHGHHPARVRLRERAGVRHLPAGHVLEAHHRHRRVPRTVRRHCRLDGLSRLHHHHRQCGRRRPCHQPHEGRLSGRGGRSSPAKWPRTSGWPSSPLPPASSSPCSFRWRRGAPRPTSN